MCQGIQAGGSREGSRQAQCQQWINQGHVSGDQARTPYVVLDLALWIGNYSPKSNLTASAGRCRHCDERRNALDDGLRISPLEIQDRAAVNCNHTNGFGGIHGAAAAEADESIAALTLIQLSAPIHQRDGRIGHHLVEENVVDVLGLQNLGCLIHEAGVHQAFVSDQHGPFGAQRLDLVAQAR